MQKATEIKVNLEITTIMTAKFFDNRSYEQ
jgi:hypothetical protein